ncbi:MAG: glycosyltransferase family 39 protein [Planctomycetes bacterium]|nr:glycosyltransferase family 39 protein [Planctomycetota bacterium]
MSSAVKPWFWVVCSVVVILGALRYLPVIDEPLDKSLASWNAAYTARYIQCWDRAGMNNLRLAPHLWISPTDPLVLSPYLHHPPFDPWLQWLGVKIFGFSEFGFRIVPIFFASLTGALIVWFLTPLGGLAFGAAAGALYLCYPMSVFYGWMPNPESATLFFIMLTIVLHERLRGRTALRYAPVWLSFFAAGMFDWQGLFAVTYILGREMLEPPATRRLGRALWFFPIGGLVALLVVAAYGYCYGSFRGAATMLLDTARQSAGGAKLYDLGDWTANQARFWYELFSVPTGFACALAFPVAGWCAWRARDPLARSLFLLALPGVTSVVVFRNHAFEHDFWWYYILPFAAAAPAWIAFRWQRNRRIAAGAVAVICLWGIYQINERYNYWTDRGQTIPMLGRDWNRLAGENDGLLLPFELGPETFYIKSWVYRPMTTVAELDEIANMAKSKKLLVRRTVCVVPETIEVLTQKFTQIGDLKFSDLIAEMARLGAVRRVSADEFARDQPILAAQLGRPVVYILTIES